MLKNIPSLLSPDLVTTMMHMGHGDELLLADAHFPAYTYNKNVIRADGLLIPPLLDAILNLLVLDTYAPPLTMMSPVLGDLTDVMVTESNYRNIIKKFINPTPAIECIDRFAFYKRIQSASAVVITGDTTMYGNILLKKGIIPTDSYYK